MTVADLTVTLDAVGPHLRSLRQDRGVTLTQVAKQTGVSVSVLSRLESGDRRPSLELLLPLARVYGVTLDELVDAPETGDPRVHLKPVVRGPMTMLPLSNAVGGLQAFKVILAARKRRTKPSLNSHEGYEWVYVLSGRLRLLLGPHDLVLEPGEAAELDTRTPHWFGPADDEEVEFLSLFGQQGERAHLRARPKPKP
jgi:DNA-binding XRE family transcriptional regulator